MHGCLNGCHKCVCFFCLRWVENPCFCSRGSHSAGVPFTAFASNVCSLKIQADSKVRAFVGEPVTLGCWFQTLSPITEKLTIDWTYRSFAGGKLQLIFHYQSEAYPAQSGTFHDRVSWAGDVSKQDASIRITSPTLEDNGTFTCTVRNPPDVQHNIPQTLLIVTPRGTFFQLTSAGLLSILIFIPSAVVVVLLLVRMGKKLGALKSRKAVSCKKSSIEVSDEPKHAGHGKRLVQCCPQCLDDDDDPY